MGFSRQEYWSGLLFPSPGDLPDPGIIPAFPMFSALAGRFFTTVVPNSSVGEESACNKGDQVKSLSQEVPLEKVIATYSNLLQCSGLENSTDRGAGRL